MARNKMEKEFRDKLNKREITPSPAAWDRLDAMLTVAEERKSKKNYTWLYIAAACIGFLLISSIFFRRAEGSVDSNEIQVVQQEKADEATSVDTIMNSGAAMPQHHDVATSGKSAPATIRKGNQNTLVAPSPNRHAIAEAPLQHKALEPKNNVEIINTDANVDELLAAAAPLQQTKKPSVKVDPNSLLSQVDGEIELSFREKVIKQAGKNFQNVKVALTNRNLE